MDLPQPFPTSLALFKLVKNEEELLALLQTRSISQLTLFFITVAHDESWCDAHLKSIHLILQRLSDAFLMRQLSLKDAQAVVTQIQTHAHIVGQQLSQDLLCLVGGSAYPISSLLLGVESSIVRNWLWEHPELLSNQEKRFSFGTMPLHTYRCLDEYLKQGRSQLLLVSTVQQMHSIYSDAVEWSLEGFRHSCLEALKYRLTPQEISLFLPLALKRSLLDLKQLCCAVWNKPEPGIKLEAENPHDLAYVAYNLPLSQWPLLQDNAEYVTRLAFRGRAAESTHAKELAALCKQVTCYDLAHTEALDDALMPYLALAEELRLPSCTWLDDSHVEQLFTQVTRLKTLDLSNNPQITKQAWNHLKHHPTIRKLKLTYYHVAQENELILILLLLAAQAVEIDLSWSSGAYDWIIEKLSFYNSSITTLRLSHCEHITDKTLACCQDRFQMLQTLDLSGDIQLSEEAIEKLALNLSSLRLLDVRRCRMTIPTLTLLRKKRPELTIIS